MMTFCDVRRSLLFRLTYSQRLKTLKENTWEESRRASLHFTRSVYSETFTRLKSSGIRMFTTGKLFEETYSHLRFADKIIKDFGSTSAAVIAAATGKPPTGEQTNSLRALSDSKRPGIRLIGKPTFIRFLVNAIFPGKV